MHLKTLLWPKQQENYYAGAEDDTPIVGKDVANGWRREGTQRESLIYVPGAMCSSAC